MNKYLRFYLEGFILRKGKIIKELTGIDYITDEDKEEMREWTDPNILTIVHNFYKESSDMSICPWCILSGYITCSYYEKTKVCQNCGYGKRHGICWKEDGNTYSEIIRKLVKKRILKSHPP